MRNLIARLEQTRRKNKLMERQSPFAERSAEEFPQIFKWNSGETFHSDEGLSAQGIRRPASGPCYNNQHQTFFGALNSPVCSYVFSCLLYRCEFHWARFHRIRPSCSFKYWGSFPWGINQASFPWVWGRVKVNSKCIRGSRYVKLEQPNMRSSALASNNMMFKKNSQDGIAFNSYESEINVCPV